MSRKRDSQPVPRIADRERLEHIERVAQALNQRKTGGGFLLTGFHDLLATLRSFVSIDDDIYPEKATQILFSAAHDSRKSAEVTAEVLQACIDARIREFKSTPPQSFSVTSTISLGAKIKFGRINSRTGRVRLPTKLTKAMEDARKALLSTRPYSRHDLSQFDHYRPVVIDVRARDPHEAMHVAMRTLNIFRAVWNLTSNRGRSVRWFGPPQPFNRIRMGPIHTVHDSEGHLAADTCWYDDVTRQAEPFNDPDAWARMRRNETVVRNCLRLSGYRRDVEDALVHYVVALDNDREPDAFLAMWGLLEFLTNCEGNYDTLVRRAAFQYSNAERALHLTTLKHLRLYRNRQVHEISSLSNHAPLAQVRLYVENLLAIHLGLTKRFNSRADLMELLSLSTDVRYLKSRIDLIRDAVRFCSGERIRRRRAPSRRIRNRNENTDDRGSRNETNGQVTDARGEDQE